MKIAIKQMVETYTEITLLMTQDMVNRDSKNLPPRMWQQLDDHSRIVQMRSQIMASTSNNLPQNDHGSKEPRDDAEITMRACKICREIEHTSKECHKHCTYCDTSHPIK
jgi:hypothetical protein